MNCNYKVKITDIQTKYKFKVFCTGYDDSEIKEKIDAMYQAWPKASGEGETATLDNTANATMSIDLKGNTSQETTTGKNLFKNFPDTKSVHSITMTNDGETISISGTNSSSTFYPSFIFYADGSVSVLSWYPTASNIDTTKGFFTESGTQYLFSMLKSGTMTGDSATYIIGKETGLTSLGLYNSESTFTNTIASNSERINFIAIGFKPSQQVDITLKMQIEKGNSRTDYERYTNGASPNPDYPQDVHVVTGENTITIANQDSSESQNYTIDLGDIELCKIGDYQDYIYKDNKKWYKYGAIGKVVFSDLVFATVGGNFSQFSTNGNIALVYEKSDLKITGNRNDAFCNLLTAYSTTIFGGAKTGLNVYYNDTKILLSVPFANVENFAGVTLTVNNYIDYTKNYIKSLEGNIYYILSTPTTTEITDTTLISQLNALAEAESYTGQTNISQTNDDKPFIITAKALKDLSNL